jgi:hypothetical protein
MKMILHILLKDLRRHWMEITGFLLVCATWAWREAHPFEWEWMRQRELIPILLFGLWFLVTVRLVQGECLVGDREWWPTRPYRWPLLMTAKALALVLCLNLPLLVAQLYLLHHADIPISWALVPGLVVLQGTLIFFVTFPAAVLASITASIMEWVITVVGLILAALALSWIPWSKLPDGLSGGEDVASWIGFGIVVPAMVLVLVWQFARRRETPARWLLGLSLLAIPLCIYLSSTTLVRSIGYPQAHGANPVQLSIPEGGSGRREFRRFHSGGQSNLAIPVVDRALDSDTIVKVDGYRAEFSGQGWHWESKWKNQASNFTHASPGVYINVEMPEAIADKVVQGGTSLKMEVAFEIYRLGPAQMVDTRAGEFEVPGVGRCSWFDRELHGISLNTASCVAPLSLPPVRVFQIDAAGDACPLREGEGAVPPGHFAYTAEFGSFDGPDPNPVRNFVLVSSPWIPAIPDVRSQNENRDAQFCQGTRFTVRTGRPVQQLRATFDLGDIGSEEPLPKRGGEDDE